MKVYHKSTNAKVYHNYYRLKKRGYIITYVINK